jgi:hypothetical protein
VGAWSFGPDEAARVAAPALLLCGAETLPQLGHLAPLTDPAELASAVGGFVSRPGRRQRSRRRNAATASARQATG